MVKTMYEELIKALRGCVLSKPCDACPYYDPNGTTKECATMNIAAADAIEKLSMKLHGDEAAIAGMKREIERMVVADKPRWIPVTEHLPEENGRYLTVMHRTVDQQYCNYLFDDDTEVRITRYYQGEWKVPQYSQGWINEAITDTVTHWMPLPEPPKEETCTKN